MRHTGMAKRRKKAKLSATKLVKAAAREQIGMPPGTRRVPDAKKSGKQKHRPTLSKLLAEE